LAIRSDKISQNYSPVYFWYVRLLAISSPVLNTPLTTTINQLLDIGVIDIETCQPLPNVLIDIWHANATGFYAGHPHPYPHLVDEKPATEGRRKGLRTGYPRTVDEENWLRGAWATNEKGVAQFSSKFVWTKISTLLKKVPRSPSTFLLTSYSLS
jgi:protocatechuate 3,4-dioxygenase beta subunit